MTPVRVAAGWQLAPHSPFFKNSAVKRTLPSTPGKKDAEKERLEEELETATRALCDLNSRMVETKIEHAQALSDQAKASRDIAVELNESSMVLREQMQRRFEAKMGGLQVELSRERAERAEERERLLGQVGEAQAEASLAKRELSEVRRKQLRAQQKIEALEEQVRERQEGVGMGGEDWVARGVAGDVFWDAEEQ
ncbi:hypothetical protein TeGR_g10772 [Tetraparma gracilis]|uniref:Uncharacterized protein n=1 Tax=Tetraparma gracilis TaxID=2962635 RepID=A0ABQ6MJH9_9STRA|nr:hypothetical protein TeGR_g10772 [Tetraparma gracilis]